MSDKRPGGLEADEMLAWTVARGQASRGDPVPPNTAAVVILTVERLAAEAGRLAAEVERLTAGGGGAVSARLRAWARGIIEFRSDLTTHYDEWLIEDYDRGRDLAHRLTLRRYDR